MAIRTRYLTRLRVFGLVASTVCLGVATLVACSDGERDLFVGTVDAPDASEASMPPTNVDAGQDAGVDAADAAPPKPDYDASDETVTCTTTPCVTQLTAGDTHFCALISDGTARCWGLDTLGSLGRGGADAGSEAGATPKPVVGITNATQISAGLISNTTCVRTADAKVQCWGDNTGAQLGLASPASRDWDAHATPTEVPISTLTPLTTGVARVDVGQGSVCAVGNDRKVYCWGSNSSRQLARPDSTEWYESPGQADFLTYEVTRAVIEQYTAFGITSGGELLNWGRVSGRDSSLSDDDGSPIPVAIPTLSGVTRFESGGNVGGSGSHECVIANGSVYCWGTNLRGILGTGIPDSERLPAYAGIVTTGVPAYPQQLALAPNRTCVRMTDGTIQCTGDDKLGQLGRGTPEGYSLTFGLATAFKEHAVQVATSTNTTCALVQGGKVVCWGGNPNGELGQGTKDTDPHPTPVPVVFE